MKTRIPIVITLIVCMGWLYLDAQTPVKKVTPSLAVGKAYSISTMKKTRMSLQLEGKLFWGENMLGNIIEFPPNFTPLAPHQHPHEQFVFCLGGEVEMKVGDKTFVMHKDDICYVPPNVLHGAVPSPTRGVTLMDVFSPVREDFIQKAIEQGTATE